MSVVMPAGYGMKNTDLILFDALTFLRASPFLAHIYKDSTNNLQGHLSDRLAHDSHSRRGDFLRLNNTPQYIHTSFCSPVPLSMALWVAPTVCE